MTTWFTIPYGKMPSIAHDPRVLGARFTSATQLGQHSSAGIVIASNPSEGIATLPVRSHTITYGSTGSGKSTCIAIPSLLVSMSSSDKPHLVIVDVKETLWSNTSGWAALCGYNVRRLDLRAERSPDCYNPLQPAYDAWRAGKTKRSEELLQETCKVLENSVRDRNDLYWQKAATRLIVDICMALFELGENSAAPTFLDVSEIAYGDETEQSLLAMQLPPWLAARLQKSFNLHFKGITKTWNCVLDTMDNMISFYTTPIGKAIAGGSTINPAKELIQQETPLALYITVPDDSGAADGYVSLLLNTIYSQYVEQFERKGMEEMETRAVMCLIDEAARLPRFGLTSIMAAGRSRRFFINLMMQSYSQLLEENRYTQEEANVLIEMADVAIYLSTTSERLGKDLEQKSGGVMSGSDLARLKRGEAIVSRLGGYPPVRTHIAPIQEFRLRGIYEKLTPPQLGSWI